MAEQARETMFQTLAKPSAVPVCVPKKIVTFFVPSSTSSSGSLTSVGLGTSSGFGFFEVDRRHMRTTKQPTRTAKEVVRMATSSRFSRMREATSAAVEETPEKSADALDGSPTFAPLMIAVIRSNGDSFIELDDDDSMIRQFQWRRRRRIE